MLKDQNRNYATCFLIREGLVRGKVPGPERSTVKKIVAADKGICFLAEHIYTVRCTRMVYRKRSKTFQNVLERLGRFKTF